MGISSIKGWVSVRSIGLAISLSVLSFSFITPSVAALSPNIHKTTTSNSHLTLNVNEFGFNFDPLSWPSSIIDWGTSTLVTNIFKPIIEGVNSFFNEIDKFINAQLEINGCTYFNAPGGQDTIANCPTPTAQTKTSAGSNPEATGFFNAWSSIRDIAYGLLVVFALIMVIAQALSFEIFDAYTVKKVLPRMLVAAIGIALSWQFIQFMAWATNALGNGITSLLSSPFNGIIISGTHTMADALAAMTGLAILNPALGLIGPIAFLVILILMFIPLFLSVIVMVLRQILVVFLAIFAPLAMVCFILPATQSVWKMWWKNFSKALLMFPMIAGALEIGKIFAATSVSVPNPGLSNFLIALIAYFGPYFLIPKMFKWSGGVLAVAGNMASKAQSSIMKFAAKQAKQQAVKQDKKIMSHNSKYGNGAGGDLYRRFRTGSLNPTKQGKANWEAKNRAMIRQSAAEKLKHSGGASTGDDYANMLAVEDGMTGADFISRYSKHLAVEKTRDKTTGVADENATASMQDVADARTALASIQTDYGGPVGSKATQLAALMARHSSVNAYGKDDAGLMLEAEETADLIHRGVITKDEAIKSIKSNKARPDQSAISFGDWSTVLDNIALNKGKSTPQDLKILRNSARNAVGPAELLGGHANAVIALAPAEAERAQEAFNVPFSSDPEEQKKNNDNYYKVLADLDNIYSQLGAVSPKMADEFLKGVLSKPIDPTGAATTDTILQALDDAKAHNQLAPFKPTFPGPMPGAGGPKKPPEEPKEE